MYSNTRLSKLNILKTLLLYGIDHLVRHAYEFYTSKYLRSLWYFIFILGRDASVLELAFKESMRVLE